MPAGSLRGLVVRVDDLGAAYDRLVSAGVDFESPPRDHPWGREAVLRDPDGNELVLQQA
jgi:predicted enzyme related to lactoylglutathione lyase